VREAAAVCHSIGTGTRSPMLYTILIILAIIALVLFIVGRRRV
jgi:LPXTG-motif cell wall-anchored protein